MLEDRIEQDIKTALLAGNSGRATTLRGLKAALLNVKVAEGKRDSGLTDDEVIAVFAKEAKKRAESATMYEQGGAADKAAAELEEKAIIEEYLPAQIDEAELTEIIKKAIADTGASGPQAMGQVIGAVKKQVGASADGAVIARIVKEQLQ